MRLIAAFARWLHDLGAKIDLTGTFICGETEEVELFEKWMVCCVGKLSSSATFSGRPRATWQDFSALLSLYSLHRRRVPPTRWPVGRLLREEIKSPRKRRGVANFAR